MRRRSEIQDTQIGDILQKAQQKIHSLNSMREDKTLKAEQMFDALEEQVQLGIGTIYRTGEVKKHTKSRIVLNLKGMSIFFVNDYGSNYYPVLSLKIYKVLYEQKFDDKLNMLKALAQMRLEMSYFNVKVGYWEPAIERLQLEGRAEKEENNHLRGQIDSVGDLNFDISLEFISIMKHSISCYDKAILRKEKEVLKMEHNQFSNELQNEM